MDESTFHSDLVKRLNIVISLLLNLGSKTESASITAKVRQLIDMGLAPAEVAAILGKSTNYVTAIMASQKTKGGKKKGRKDL